MAKFLNAVLFNPTAGGTTDFTVSAAVQGYMTPNAAGASNGAVYRYRAENATLTEWEIGYGTYNTGTGVLTRSVVLYNSLGTTAKINFTAAPNVGMGMPLATDIFPFVSDTPPTAPADNALWWEADTGVLYIYYNDGTSSQWVGIQSQATIAAVLYTAQSLSDAQQKQARENIGVPKKNYVVNSAMMISQENGTTAGATSGYYAADQFLTNFSNGGTCSVAQVASTTPGGSPNRIRYTVTAADAAVAAGDFAGLETRIEGYRVADLLIGSASAKTVTLRFGVKAPAGTYCVVFLNSGNNRSYVTEYVIAGGEANTDVVKTVVVPLDQSGTWLKDNSIGLIVRWGLMAGTTFQQVAGSWGTANAVGTANQFNFMGTNGNVFELFDVGLYEGSVAPAFVVPDYISELLACQRYWESSFPLGVQPVSNTSVGGYLTAPVQSATANINIVSYCFKAMKRATPTITTYNPFAAGSGFAVGGTGNFSVIVYSSSSQYIALRDSAGGASVGGSINIHLKADARL